MLTFLQQPELSLHDGKSILPQEEAFQMWYVCAEEKTGPEPRVRGRQGERKGRFWLFLAWPAFQRPEHQATSRCLPRYLSAPHPAS